MAAGRSPFGAAIAVVAALGGLVGLAACGGPQRGAEGEGGAGREQPAAPAAPDTRTPIERRRDAACEQLGPRLTACAVEDARASFTAGKIDRAQLERDTAPAVQRKNTEEFLKACKGATYSSRQVRVLEVCFHDETRCAPLLDCLGHLSDRPASGSR
ncbi:MAG TPA: hypothetical protein VFT22_45080 [Kofleriaceae bacterium]|nr:hypothetical protein [Kofleriaceae bacterium]